MSVRERDQQRDQFPDVVRKRVARALWRHNERMGIKRQFMLDAYLPYADAILVDLGLDSETLEVVADWRYSNEFVGNVLRSRFLD